MNNRYSSFSIIDAHVHVIERLAGYGARGEMRSVGNGLARWANGEEVQILPRDIGDSFSPEKLINIMDSYNVTKAIMMQGSYYGFCNDYTHEAQEKYPDRLYGMGTFDPFSKMSNAIMENLIDNYHFKGFKFEMSESFGFMGYHSDFRLDSSVMDKVWAMAQDRQLVISLDLGTFGENSMQLNELAKIARQIPKVKFVIEHIFFPHLNHFEDVRQSLSLLENSDNINFTIASIPTSTLPEQYPYPSAQKYIKIAKEQVGVDRLMWGSDLPSVLAGTPYNQLIDYIQNGIFTDEELRKIFRENAIRVYQI